MNVLCALIGDIPRRSIIHTEVRDIEAAYGTGITNTPRSELALADQDSDLFIESELHHCSIRECPSLVPGSWLTLSLRGLRRGRGEESYWLERWYIAAGRTGREKGRVVVPWRGKGGKQHRAHRDPNQVLYSIRASHTLPGSRLEVGRKN